MRKEAQKKRDDHDHNPNLVYKEEKSFKFIIDNWWSLTKHGTKIFILTFYNEDIIDWSLKNFVKSDDQLKKLTFKWD